nr:eukaryotic translation initiation factor 3 subunit A [Cryptococcus depauperatus CBS 7855]
MPPIYAKPENALKRSEELLALGTLQSQQQAFDNLVEVFQSKRFKQTPTTVLEPIVTKFIDLCVTLDRKAYVKSGLLVFKSAVQTTSIASIERALNHFIAQAEARLSAAVEQAKKEVAALPDVPVVDDDLPLQPASLLLDAFVDNAGDRERIERRLIGPAQKFCWDAYDICLDIAKSNDRLEVIYQSIAHRAFSFCKIHQRKTDFRRLCEQRLRKDLANAAKYPNQQHAINLSDPETLGRFLETRFLQLETAVELELWQEAFRSIEDVHGLIAGRKSTKASMMANYYEKLTQIFKAEGGKQTAVFHAAAWARYYQQAERAGSVNDKASGCVLLSALAVPLGEVETKQRLVALLNLPKMPTREALVSDAAAKHLKRVPSDIRQIYDILEIDFEPTTASKVLAPLIINLAPEYQPYLPALRDVVLSRLLQELAQVYDSVTISHIMNLVKPLENTPWATDVSSLEKFLVTACQRDDIRASVDHVTKTITFVSSNAAPARLQSLAVCLYNTISYLSPSSLVPAPPSRSEAFAVALAQAEEERKLASHKRQIIIRRRELLEEAKIRREKEESTALAERLKAKAEEETRRAKEEAKQAEIDRVRKQINETKEAEAKQLAASLAAQGALKVDISTIENLDSSKLVAMQVEQLAKEKKEFSEKLRIVGKKVDHLERALRRAELPLLTEDYERQKKEDRAAWETANEIARQQAIEQQKAAKELKERLARMLPDYYEMKERLESQMETELKQARDEARRRIEEEKAELKARVIKKFKEERARKAKEAADAEERKRCEEESAARQAEEEAKKAAAAETAAQTLATLKAEKEAERQKALEISRRQQEREQEAFDRRAAEKAATVPRQGVYRPPSAYGGASQPWRSTKQLSEAQSTVSNKVSPPASTLSPSPANTTMTNADASNGPGNSGAAPEKPGAWRRGANRRAMPSTRGST